MFLELPNQIWNPSSASVVVSNNTDVSIDGSSKKIVWTEATNEYVDIDFDATNFSNYEELSFHVMFKDLLGVTTLFAIIVGTTEVLVSRDDLRSGKWNHILMDTTEAGVHSKIRIQSKIPNLTLIIDYIGVRYADNTVDRDLVLALKNHIVLDYGVDTTLSADASIGDEQISLVSVDYLTENPVLLLDDGSSISEEVRLLDSSGNLTKPLENDFPAGSRISVICPVLNEGFESVEPDPVCGIAVTDLSVEKDEVIVETYSVSKVKQFLGALGVTIYIDCSYKKKVLELARQFQNKYGKWFQFLLDGEQVDVFLEASMFVEDTIGNNPRMAYFYRIEPQPFTIEVPVKITEFNITLEVQEG